MIKKNISFFDDFLKYPVEQRFLILIPLFASFLTGITVIEGFFLHDTYFTLACALSTLVFVVTFFLIRANKSLRVAAWIMILNTLMLTNIVWFRFEGSKGTSPAVLMMLLVCICLFFKKTGKVTAISIVLVNLFFLFLLEYKFPSLINKYENRLMRMMDIFITYSVCGIFIVFIVHGVLKSYLHEKLKAERVDKLKSAFLANISHEIRTPLNAILGFSSLIVQPTTKKKDQLIYSRYISEASSNMVNIVDEIISIARIESNQYQIQKVKCNVTDILKYVYTYFKDSTRLQLKNNLDFSVSSASIQHDVYIETDPELLKRVLFNLVDNSLKFTQNGFIEFGFDKRSSDLLFYVKDSGIGIPKEDCNRVFDSFSKVDHKKDKIYDGIGLGLNLSKKILELLYGKIWVDSEINKGSTFYFTIPYDKIEIEPSLS